MTDRLTQRTLNATAAPATGATFLRDGELKGFGVRITANNVRSYILEKRIDGKVKRITLGRVAELNLQQARQKALGLLGEIAMGGDPVADVHRARLEAITLREACDEYLKHRRSLKPNTVRQYRAFLNTIFAPWADRPLPWLTKDRVTAYHRELGESRGPYQANGAMRFLRAVLNFALERYEDADGNPILKDNPCLRLTRTRGWYKSHRRQTVLKAHQLADWYRAVTSLRAADEGPCAATVADYLLVLVFTGLRRSEAAKLRWADVDLKDRSLTIPDPKNGEPLTIPLAAPVLEILTRRRTFAESPWVFPGTGKAGHLIEPKKSLRRVYERAGFRFCLHDLRRTFATVADSLDVSPYAIKRLMNHKMRQDVTAGYIVSDLERLRVPAERIAECMARGMGMAPAPVPNVVALPPMRATG